MFNAYRTILQNDQDMISKNLYLYQKLYLFIDVFYQKFYKIKL